MYINADQINPFFRAFYERVHEVMPPDVFLGLGDFKILKEPLPHPDIKVISNLSGQLCGKAILSMDTRLALEISEAMYGKPVDSFESDAQSAITELLNIIIGNSLRRLENLSFSPTHLFYGKVNALTNNNSVTISRAIKTGWGDIELNLVVTPEHKAAHQPV